MKTLEQKIAQIISESLSVDLNKVVPAATLEDLGGDSLDAMELVMEFEEGFDIEIADEVAEKFTTVKDFTDHIVNEVSLT